MRKTIIKAIIILIILISIIVKGREYNRRIRSLEAKITLFELQTGILELNDRTLDTLLEHQEIYKQALGLYEAEEMEGDNE